MAVADYVTRADLDTMLKALERRLDATFRAEKTAMERRLDATFRRYSRELKADMSSMETRIIQTIQRGTSPNF